MMTFEEFKKKKMYQVSKSTSSVASETVIPFPSKKKLQATPPVFTIATDNVDDDNNVVNIEDIDGVRDNVIVNREDYAKWKR